MFKYAARKMGLMRKSPAMDPSLTRPQGLYGTGDVDLRKLKRLILAGKLAPCYPGREEVDEAEGTASLDECPICFLSYPCLNRSRCCASSICTECFLQVKAPSRVAPGEDPTAKCPFCKTPGYTVAFKGKKTESERQTERQEELEVEAAKARLREDQLRSQRDRADRRAAAAAAAESESAESERPPASAPPSAAGEGDPASPVPVGWEEEYAAMTPQRRNPEALRRPQSQSQSQSRARGSRAWTAPAPPSPLPDVESRWEARARALRAEALERERAGGGGFPSGARGRGPSGAEGEPARDADDAYYEVEGERAVMRELARRRGASARRGPGPFARRRDGSTGGEGAFDDDAEDSDSRVDPDALDPAFLRRIQEYVPARLLDAPIPAEARDAAGRRLDLEDVMMMEALYLSLRDQDRGETEEARRRREEEEAAAEAAEVADAIARVAAAEAAEAAARRGEAREGGDAAESAEAEAAGPDAGASSPAEAFVLEEDLVVSEASEAPSEASDATSEGSDASSEVSEVSLASSADAEAVEADVARVARLRVSSLSRENGTLASDLAELRRLADAARAREPSEREHPDTSPGGADESSEAGEGAPRRRSEEPPAEPAEGGGAAYSARAEAAGGAPGTGDRGEGEGGGGGGGEAAAPEPREASSLDSSRAEGRKAAAAPEGGGAAPTPA